MAEILSLDPEVIRNEAGVCATAAESMAAAHTELINLAKEIQAGWEGTASDVFVEIVESKGSDAMTSMITLCTSMSQELTAVAESVETLDDETANAYKGE